MTTVALQTLTANKCANANGGTAPVVAAVVAVLTSDSFIAFTAAITLIGFAADIGIELIE